MPWRPTPVLCTGQATRSKTLPYMLGCVALPPYGAAQGGMAHGGTSGTPGGAPPRAMRRTNPSQAGARAVVKQICLGPQQLMKPCDGVPTGHQFVILKLLKQTICQMMVVCRPGTHGAPGCHTYSISNLPQVTSQPLHPAYV